MERSIEIQQALLELMNCAYNHQDPLTTYITGYNDYFILFH